MSAVNREILFRGFHPCEDGDTTIYVEGKAVKGRWIYWDMFGELTEPLLNDFNMHSHVSEFDVLPSTVCQHTGLTDKNCVKIFEGDIATDGVYEYIVTFSEGAWVRKQTYLTGSSYSTVYHVAKQREVIGTIWDKERQDERD